MNRWIKRLGYAVGGFLGMVLLAAAGVYGFSEARYRKQYDIAPGPITVKTDSIAVARGSHLAHAIAGCAECHGANLEGAVVVDDPAFGRIYAPNLTSGKGGLGGKLSEADIVRAVRHGVGPDGRALKIMPSEDYVSVTDEDLASIVAFVKSSPPVDHETPAITVGPIARMLMVAGKLPLLHAETIDHSRPSIASVTPAATIGYGAYLANIGCRGCHGPKFSGGRIASGPPDWPPAANLTPAGPTKDWKEEDFRRVLREGKRPDGSPVNVVMPWKMTRNMTDDEIRAVYLYTRSLPAVGASGQ